MAYSDFRVSTRAKRVRSTAYWRRISRGECPVVASKAKVHKPVVKITERMRKEMQMNQIINTHKKGKK